MEKKNNTLLLILLVTALLIMCLGDYLKCRVLAPLELYLEESVIVVPFLLLSDEAIQDEIRLSIEPTEPPTILPTESTVPTQPATEPPTEPPTELPTEPPTEPIVIDDSWFDDVLFIGDSRTACLKAYAPLGEAHYFCDTAMSVFDVRSKKIGNDGFYKTNLAGLLTKNTYGKVYIVLGINGMHMPHEDILVEYQELINLIREKQPDAAIVLHSIMTVGRNKAASIHYYNIDNIYALNEKISELAVDDNMFYIDVNEWAADEEGYLPDDMSKDGCHLYAKEYAGWAQWLKDSATTLGIQ